MHKLTDDDAHTPAEREELLAKMSAVSHAFYAQATRAGVHAFIEFCGLMNEFIQVCHRAHQAGLDFTMANTHTGIELPFEVYNAEYLAEKLNCIYGPALISNEKAREAFIATMFEGRFKLAPTPAAPARSYEDGVRDGLERAAEMVDDCADDAEDGVSLVGLASAIRELVPVAAEEQPTTPPARDAFHRHLDACSRCREQPFNLCLAGLTLLKAAAQHTD